MAFINHKMNDLDNSEGSDSQGNYDPIILQSSQCFPSDIDLFQEEPNSKFDKIDELLYGKELIDYSDNEDNDDNKDNTAISQTSIQNDSQINTIIDTLFNILQTQNYFTKTDIMTQYNFERRRLTDIINVFVCLGIARKDNKIFHFCTSSKIDPPIPIRSIMQTTSDLIESIHHKKEILGSLRNHENLE
ncbi:hypothetical protein TRFO_20103 [Tritrichomonas foetus]|uniref:E2F/DP family winged-helix DNA-binding domain-containing protein n=1 Tax=Tritrichomonas foetus TaxID=1144522 RepID=A0A1J4KH65_9EUKA|nr:hypothetical protein TRFO_20103 [Tritrichomonas foetus]|eukprot:OHT10523.1 hypothetical protein TRFO_20103 [Tritrichomonas foetus]